jgi:hypothetical protein
MLIARHFPIVRFEDGEKRWFNPVSKTRVADRPEERVRLRMVEFLVREAGFSLNHITTEMPVKLSRDQHALRADILCFDSLLRPLLLVECKAESVPINEKTAIQSAGYNRNIGAPHVLLSNGIRDVLYTIREDGSPLVHRQFEERFPRMVESPRTLTYWQERGLWGGISEADDEVRGPVKGAISEADDEDSDTGRGAEIGIYSGELTVTSGRLSRQYEAKATAVATYLSAFWETSAGHTQYLELRLPDQAAEAMGVDVNQSFFARVAPSGATRATGTAAGSAQRTATGIFATAERRTIGITIIIRGDGSRQTTVFEPELQYNNGTWRVNEVIRWDG